jgi:hypothetical protein
VYLQHEWIIIWSCCCYDQPESLLFSILLLLSYPTVSVGRCLWAYPKYDDDDNNDSYVFEQSYMSILLRVAMVVVSTEIMMILVVTIIY